MKEIRIDPNGAGKRMDKFLMRYLSGAPASLIYAQLRKKNITLDHKKATGSEILSEGDTIQCFFADGTWEKFLHPGLKDDSGNESYLAEATACYASHPMIRILYEDADFLIAEKPAGLLTQRAKPGDESLNDWLIGYLLRQGKTDAARLAVFRPSAAHRLDRNTGGIVCMTLTLWAAQETARL
ncbi:MAG: RluA family pseudouridine synthase, partial [Lachnospiraceae bacterium]|nr:RluA family pseudouridine synthase [Lachnospiraceae bacterium]